MCEASTKFSTKLNEQVKQMESTFKRSADAFTRKLTTVETKQATHLLKSKEQDEKVNKLEQDHVKTVRKWTEETSKTPKPTPACASCASAITAAGAKAKLGFQLQQAETRLNEAYMRAQSSEEQAQQQGTKIMQMESELAVVAEKWKVNQARINDVKIRAEAVQEMSRQKDATLANLVNNAIDLKGKLTSADTALTVLETGAKFGDLNVAKLNEKIPKIKEKLFSAESKLDSANQKIDQIGSPTGGGSNSGSCSG